LPKILAPIAGRPFLDWLLDWLTEQGTSRVILGLGYRADAVLDYLAATPRRGLEIVPVIEPQPLGTAGAVGFAMPHFRTDPVLILNGDTILETDLPGFAADHRRSSSPASIVCVWSTHPQRYGRVDVDGAGRILAFREKDLASEPGWISGGVYLFGRAMLDRVAAVSRGSLEHDVLARMPSGSIHAYCTGGGFLDIGTPESLADAEKFLSCWRSSLERQ
jgi:mannose-1-phosphate guanylyltransferase